MIYDGNRGRLQKWTKKYMPNSSEKYWIAKMNNQWDVGGGGGGGGVPNLNCIVDKQTRDK